MDPTSREEPEKWGTRVDMSCISPNHTRFIRRIILQAGMPLSRRSRRLILAVVLYLTFCSVAGIWVADGTLHPPRRPLTPEDESAMIALCPRSRRRSARRFDHHARCHHAPRLDHPSPPPQRRRRHPASRPRRQPRRHDRIRATAARSRLQRSPPRRPRARRQRRLARNLRSTRAQRHSPVVRLPFCARPSALHLRARRIDGRRATSAVS